jgi:hypothetical protein
MKGKQMGNAKLWILIAALVAAAAAVLVISDNFPPGEESVSGTIVPAERYGASQISSEDVVLGTDSNADSSSTQPVDALTADVASNAARSNDVSASNSVRVLSNDINAVNAARANDINAINAARANDINAINAARANDINAVNAARANDGRD